MDDRPRQQQSGGTDKKVPARDSVGSSEERLRALFAAVPDLILQMDREGRCLDYSPSTEFTTYVPADRFLGTRMRELMPPDVVSVMTEAIERVLEFHTRETVEYELPETSGVRYREARIARSGPNEVVAVVRDITDRKIIENALRASERRYRQLFEESRGINCTHDLDGNFLTLNPAAAHFIGYEPHELVGRNLADVIVPSAVHLLPAYLERIQAEGEDNGIIHLVSRSGEKRYWAYRNVLREDEDSGPYVIGHALDVTDLKRAENSARMSRAQCDALVRNLPLAMCQVSVESESVSANRRFHKMLGYDSTDDALDCKLSEIVRDRDTLDRLLGSCLEAGAASEVDIPWRCKDGSTVVVRSAVWPVKLDDGTTVSVDIVALP
ncbi:MAG: PAS domain S-box protein [Gemmatimonadales bacterium]